MLKLAGFLHLIRGKMYELVSFAMKHLFTNVFKETGNYRNNMTAFALPTNYQSIIYLVLTFADGLIFGIAIKKGILSFILMIIGVLIGTYVGISLPGVSLSLLLSKVIVFLGYILSKAPSFAVGLPVLFLIGLAIGLWKG